MNAPSLPSVDTTPFRARRVRLLARMQAAGGGVAILPTAPERVRNRDAHYAYRHDSYFYYLTGFREPEAVVVLVAGKETRQILFCREKNEEREIWDGYRWGPDAAREAFGFDEAWTIGDLEKRLPNYLADQPLLWTSLGYDNDWDAKVLGALNAVRDKARSGLTPPHSVRDLRAELDEMRLVKDASELDTMRRAAQISADAHCRAMRATRPGRYEFEIEAELLHAFRAAGSQAPAYTSIVAGGANACVLHYVENDQRLNDGDLLLIDAGCELDGYASDITRTFPANGTFTGPQRALYDLVLASQDAAVAATKAGARFNDPHDATVAVLAQGMLDLGLLDRNKVGAAQDVIDTRAYFQFYMHRTGHWMGMDVHDCGSYVEPSEVGHTSERKDPLSGETITNRPSRILRPGMVLTIEPGIYVRPAPGVPEEFHHIGIRIEDDAIVTDAGCELITRGVPVQPGEIEALMRA